MSSQERLGEIDKALRHAGAGVKALEAVRATLEQGGSVNHTHLKLASAELAHAIELALKLSLRSQ